MIMIKPMRIQDVTASMQQHSTEQHPLLPVQQLQALAACSDMPAPTPASILQ